MRQDNQAEREFLIGVLWGAYFLHTQHGCDQLAAELLCTSGSAQMWQRIARAEKFKFQRGFWAYMQRRSQYRKG